MWPRWQAAGRTTLRKGSLRRHRPSQCRRSPNSQTAAGSAEAPLAVSVRPAISPNRSRRLPETDHACFADPVVLHLSNRSWTQTKLDLTGFSRGRPRPRWIRRQRNAPTLVMIFRTEPLTAGPVRRSDFQRLA